jgi:hypothetical protein
MHFPGHRLNGAALIGVGSMPTLQIFLGHAGFLFFLDRPFPWLVGLFGIFPIRALAGIVVRFLFAHGRPHSDL